MTCPFVRGDTTQYCTLNCPHDHERVEALRHTLPCPHPGCVNGEIATHERLPSDVVIHSTTPCPENNGACDGFMSWERIVAIVAAVFDDDTVAGLFRSRAALAHLRSVRP